MAFKYFMQRKENVLIKEFKKAAQVKVNEKAQGAPAWPKGAEHMEFVCWLWLDITNGFCEGF